MSAAWGKMYERKTQVQLLLTNDILINVQHAACTTCIALFLGVKVFSYSITVRMLY